MESSLNLLLKLSNEERLAYLNKKIDFMEIKEDFRKKDNEAHLAVIKIHEASQRFSSLSNITSFQGRGVAVATLNETKIAVLHQMNQVIGEAIDFSENFTFLYNRYKEAEESFNLYESELYDKYKLKRTISFTNNRIVETEHTIAFNPHYTEITQLDGTTVNTRLDYPARARFNVDNNDGMPF